MQQKNTPSSKKRKASTQKRDHLAKYRQQARVFIRLYFGKDTPEFVRDLLSSWYSNLESETQIFWNVKEVAEVAIPLMLKAADEMGIDVEAPSSLVCVEALQECLAMHKGDTVPDFIAERDKLQAELEKDAAAIAQLLNSPHTPTEIRNTLSEQVLGFTDFVGETEEVLLVQYPLAVTRTREREKDGKQ